MYCDQKKIYIIFAAYALPLFLVSFSAGKLTGNICLAALALLGAAAGAWIIKKKNAPDRNRNQVALIAGLSAAAGVMLVCLLGLHFGFYKNSLSFKTVYTYIIPISVAVIGTEIFRSNLLAQKQKTVRILSYFLFVFSDILLFAEKNSFRNVSSFMSLFAFAFLPALTSNLLCHRFSYKYGARSVIPYRLIMALYPYVLPFGVKIPRAMYSFIGIVFPMFVLWLVKLMFDKRDMTASVRRTPVRTALSVLCIALVLISVAFIAELFPYRPIVVASDSMKGELDTGDVVVYEAYNGQHIQNGQIILFKRGNSIIIHRVVDIKKINGEYRYYTKGDANDGVDTGYITESDIVGISSLKIKYIGYPTVWLHDIFRNKK